MASTASSESLAGPPGAGPTLERLLSEDNARAYGRFIAWSVGAGFKLGVVEVVEPWRRDALVAWTSHAAPGTREVRLDRACHEPLRSLVEQAVAPPGEVSVLVLTHLEEASDRRMVCAQLNVQRDDLARDFAVPWVVLVHPDAVLDLQMHAPDFSDFAGMWLGADAAEAGTPAVRSVSSGQAIDSVSFPHDGGGGPGSDLLARAEAAIRAGRLDHARDLLVQHAMVRADSAGSLSRAVVEGRLLLTSGDIAGAQTRFEGMLHSYERDNNELGVATALHNLGNALATQGKYEEAESLFRRAVDIRARALGSHHPDYGASLRGLGNVLRERGSYGEAEALLRRALVIGEEGSGIDSQVHSTLHSLGLALHAQGNHGEAENLLRQALAIAERELGAEHPDYAASLSDLTGVLAAQGKYAEAEGAARQALAIYEKTLGIDHPRYGFSLHNLAAALQTQGQYREAEGLLRRSLVTYEKTLGVDHPAYGRSLANLANVLKTKGRYGEAEGLLRQSLVTKERALGGDHPDLAPTLASLAAVLADEDRLLEAEHLLRRAMRIAEQGHDHRNTADILTVLARVEFKLGKPEANDTAQHALDIRIATLGRDHPITKQAALNLTILRIASDTTDARIRASVEQAQAGDASGAIRALEALANEASAADAPGPELSARVALAEILAATRQPFLAGIQLRVALAIAERLGDVPAAGQLRAKLDALEPRT